MVEKNFKSSQQINKKGFLPSPALSFFLHNAKKTSLGGFGSNNKKCQKKSRDTVSLRKDL